MFYFQNKCFTFKTNVSIQNKCFTFKTNVLVSFLYLEPNTKYHGTVSWSPATMFCEYCNTLLEENFVFCLGCGVELNREELILTNYFEKGFQYDKIRILLAKFHNRSMSLRDSKEQVKIVWFVQKVGERRRGTRVKKNTSGT